MRIALAFSFFVFDLPSVIARNEAIPCLQSGSVGWGLPRYRSQ